MGDSMTSLLIPIGFLLMNVVILLIWWIVRRERSRITQIEQKVDTVAGILMDIQAKQQIEQQRNYQEQQVDNVSRVNQIPERTTEVSEEDSVHSEESVENRIQEEQEVNEHVIMDVNENEHDDEHENEHDDEHENEHDDDTDYGSELDSLTDNEEIEIQNQNDAHDKISVSDVESLHEPMEETTDEHNVKTINLHDNSQLKEVGLQNTYQGMFELGENEEQHDTQQENEDDEPIQKRELDEEQFKQLSKLTVKELRKLATEKGIHHVDKLKKKTLVIQLSTKPVDPSTQTEETNSDGETNE